MGVLTLKEDRPTPKAVYNWRVYMCATVASIAACMIGYDSAFIGGTLALPSFKSEFDFASYQPGDLALVQANIVSVYQAGAFFGSIMAFVTNYYLGRRKSLLIFVVVFTLGAGMMLGANKQRGLSLIIVGRVLAGIGVGASSNVVPIYISEISPPAVRGRLVGTYEFGWQIGGLVGFWINYGVSTTMAPSHTQWLVPFAVQLIPSGMLFFGALWMKESPRWLFSRGRRDEAVQNLVWIRNLEADDIYMVEEIGYIDADLDRYAKEVGRGFWKPFGALSDRKIQWRFFLGAFMFLWQNGSGINAINYYSPTVFASIGIRGTNASLLTTGIFGVVKTILTIIWLLWLIDQFGRRAMLLIGAIGGGLCMYYIGGYIALAGVSPSNSPSTSSNESIRLSPAGISAIFMFYLWTAFYTPSWNGTPWVLNSEMYDLNTRALGQAWAACNNWFWNFLISRFTPQMFLTMGFGVYIFFGSLMMVSAVFVWFLVPETKSIPLEKMDRLFEIKPVWKANQLIMEEIQLEDEQFRRNAGGPGVSTEKASEDRKEAA